MKQPEYEKVTTTITKDTKELAEKHNIQYSTALNAGIQFLTQHHKMLTRMLELERRIDELEVRERSDIRMLRDFVISIMREPKQRKRRSLND